MARAEENSPMGNVMRTRKRAMCRGVSTKELVEKVVTGRIQKMSWEQIYNANFREKYANVNSLKACWALRMKKFGAKYPKLIKKIPPATTERLINSDEDYEDAAIFLRCL